jgi:thiamine kinase
MHSVEVVIALSGIGGGNAASAERIKHGLTNESWLVSSADECRVVRISNPEDDSLQINRASEAIILATVGRAGIGPEVIVCDPARRLLVTRYAGETWSDEDAHRVENIDGIAALLGRLHALPAPSGIQRVNLLAVIDGYVQTLEAHAMVCEVTAPTLRARARDIAVALYQDAGERLCHNDVHALNIVTAGGALRLIDWEYAGLGEPLFDLASISVYHRYDVPERERLLTAYLQRVDTKQWQRLDLACWLFGYIRDLWTAVREMPSDARS